MSSELTHNWDDPMFLVRSDPARRARYRRLQSWYRQAVLGVNAGLDSGGRPIGSLLPSEAVQSDPSLNFLRDERLARIALDRLAENRGTFVGDRLKRNLLSSQPLCVNLFGMLKLHPDAAAVVLAAVTGLPIERVDLIEIERAPDLATAVLNDRTAFDAYVEYRSSAGDRGFLGIETKYTEPFSDDLGLGEAKRDKYRRLAELLPVFTTPLSADLLSPKASQLFRNLLLSLAHADEEQIPGHVVVVALAADPDAAAGVRIVREQLLAPDDHLRSASIESIVDAARTQPVLAAWAQAFTQRYLDLTPVTKR